MVALLLIDRKTGEPLAPVDLQNRVVIILHAHGNDVCARDTDVLCALVSEIVDIVDHLPFFAGRFPVFMAYIDHRTDLILCDRGIPPILWNPENRHHTAGEKIHQENHRRKENHQYPDDPCVAQCQLLRGHICRVFRGDFSENEHEQRQQSCHESDRLRSEQFDGQGCGEGRSGYIHKVVSDQDTAEHLALRIENLQCCLCTEVSRIRQVQDPDPVHRGQCGLSG